MGSFDFFNKKDTDRFVSVDGKDDDKKDTVWSVEVDGEEQDIITPAAITEHLNAIINSDKDFLILTPSHPVSISKTERVCNFVQLCQDEESGLFHLEVSTIKADKEDDIVIYGKDGFIKESILSIINDLLQEDLVPDIKGWETVLEL